MREPEPVPVKWSECACGGVVVAQGPRDIEAAMQRHHTEVRHLLWRIANLKREVNA